VRERGVQARRARAADGERPPTPPPAIGLRFWQVLAIVALIAATAGWTMVAVMTLRPAPAGQAAAAPTDEPAPTDDASLEPPVESHEVADLEALLPAELNGTSLTRESWTGGTILGDDAWSSAVTTFLTGAGKTAADLQTSQAYDQVGTLDLSVGAFRVAGLDAAALRDAMISAWKGDYPDLKIAQTTIGGLDVTTGDFGEGAVKTYWYVRDGVLFDIETGDPSIAQAALSGLPTAGASAVPSSPVPASAGPSRSPVASPS
jgi:hypothetical protein